MLQNGKLFPANLKSTRYCLRSFSSIYENPIRRCIKPIVLRDHHLVTMNNLNSVRLLSVSALRWDGAQAKEELIIELPPRPIQAPDSSELVFSLPDKPVPVDMAALGEPSLESLGLASWWPSGRMQYLLENVRRL